MPPTPDAASVFVTRRIPEAGLEVLRAAGIRFEIGHDDEESATPRPVLLDGVARHDVLLSLLTEAVDREVLERNPRLRGVSQMAVGVDNIDLETAARLGVPVAHTPGVLTDATADLAFTLLLAVARRVVESHAYTLAGRFTCWGPNLLLGRGVGPGPDGTPKTLGIVGFGRIGRAMARRAAGFGMRILVSTRSPETAQDAPGVEVVEFDELLRRSDFVSLHVPGTAATRHLIGADELARMRAGAVLINTARGTVVDEAALVEALRSGHVGGAGLDVYEREPELAPGLAELPNVVLLPHVGSATAETRDHMAVLAAGAAVAFARGERAGNLVGGG